MIGNVYQNQQQSLDSKKISESYSGPVLTSNVEHGVALSKGELTKSQRGRNYDKMKENEENEERNPIEDITLQSLKYKPHLSTIFEKYSEHHYSSSCDGNSVDTRKSDSSYIDTMSFQNKAHSSHIKLPNTSNTRRITIPRPPRLLTMEKNGQRMYSVYYNLTVRNVESSHSFLSQSHSANKKKKSTKMGPPRLRTMERNGERSYANFGRHSNQKPLKSRIISNKPRTMTIPVPFNLSSSPRKWKKQEASKKHYVFKALPLPDFSKIAFKIGRNSRLNETTIPNPFDLSKNNKGTNSNSSFALENRTIPSARKVNGSDSHDYDNLLRPKLKKISKRGVKLPLKKAQSFDKSKFSFVTKHSKGSHEWNTKPILNPTGRYKKKKYLSKKEVDTKKKYFSKKEAKDTRLQEEQQCHKDENERTLIGLEKTKISKRENDFFSFTLLKTDIDFFPKQKVSSLSENQEGLRVKGGFGDDFDQSSMINLFRGGWQRALKHEHLHR